MYLESGIGDPTMFSALRFVSLNRTLESVMVDGLYVILTLFCYGVPRPIVNYTFRLTLISNKILPTLVHFCHKSMKSKSSPYEPFWRSG